MCNSQDVEDFPSGFEGQHINKDTFTKKLNDIDIALKKYDSLGEVVTI